MSSGGKQATQTQVQSAEPWPVLRPHLEGLYKDTAALGDQPRAFFPESTVPGFAPETEAALRGTASRAAGGSPLVNAAQGLYADTIGGKYLGADNPALAALADRSMRLLKPRMDAAFARGPAGSPGHEFALASAFADSMAPYLYGDYSTERGRQMSAAAGAPSLAREDYADLAALRGVGAEREEQQSRVIQDALARFNFGQEDPWTILARRSGIFQPGLQFGTTTATTTGKTPGQSPLMQLLGLGLAGAGVASGLGWAPFAASAAGTVANRG
jgi:hypothetical protein